VNFKKNPNVKGLPQDMIRCTSSIRNFTFRKTS